MSGWRPSESAFGSAEEWHAVLRGGRQPHRHTKVRQQGTRLGDWLTKERVRDLLAVPGRSTLKGKRDYCILALLVGCALRRRELASLTVEDIQLRENRWVIADLRGKGGRIRTAAVPMWVKESVNAWQTAEETESGPVLRAIANRGKVLESFSDWAV